MTVQEATQHSRQRLQTIYEKGEADAIIDWLLEHVLQEKKSNRINYPKRILSTEQSSRLEGYLQRLLTHEPIQYVLNEAWFCGLKLYVDENVLIPRPETEELVEWIITNCRFPIDELKILDIGTGSGCIPIALKRRLGKAELWSCDISDAALQVAMQNAKAMGVEINFRHLDFLLPDQRISLPSFDIIVSNPPYIPETDKQEMQANVVQYEPATALFVPDNDPLVFYKAIADFGKDHLNKQGMIFTELHESMSINAAALFQSKGYTSEIKKDMQGKERMLKIM